MGVGSFQWRSRRAGAITLGAVAAAGVAGGLHTATTPGIDLLSRVLGVGFPLVVSLGLLGYVYRYRDHRDGATLLSFAAVGSVALTLYFVLTAVAIIWGQRTLGVEIGNPVIVTAQLAMVGAMLGLLLGHLYGRSITTRERLRRRTIELERQNERLDEFASVVSHDLRNPLNVAVGGVELAKVEREGEHLEMVEGALRRMEVLIDDVLTLAREGEAPRTLEPVDVGSVARTAWQHVETEIATLEVTTTRTILADRGRLQQLLENLVRNAVEHGSTGSQASPMPDDAVDQGSPDVTVTVGSLDDGFYVEDDGSGIPAGERERVFETGYSAAGGGTGLGLAIVERIVDAHDWEIHVTASASGGARFEITGIEPVPEED